MNNEIIDITKNKEDLPDHIYCPYCKEKMSGALDQGTYMIYSCDRHQPITIDYYYTRTTLSKRAIPPPNKWINAHIIISNSNSFRLVWNYSLSGNNFYLQEYEKVIPGQRLGGWYGYKSTSFSIDWVLSQTPARIISLLEMYKVFS